MKAAGTLMLVCSLLASSRVSWGFVTTTTPIISRSPFTARIDGRSSIVLKAVEEASFVDGIVEKLQTSLRIAQDSNAKGYDFKQTLANVLAGEYDEAAIQAQIDADIASAPCVMFTWERSPSCVKAVEALEVMGIDDQVKIVRLDDPWDKGNPIRAELGKRVGRSSVPIIFIGGDYVGGFDGGVSDAAPGIQSMAFQGTFRPKLEQAGLKFPALVAN
eukprot:CAMPEP_0198143536 /NCGR_PEP_ID=MMETSP1443-20131203/8497_1 /TAXON_ID=186043 /ORGANISM="Entomoneis sp., Strain CCMP2396" /LENGTH=216 /DNA_ID=CAMNT_0043806787 /DNA_START=71 /DNA_END=721 /DNA_ORIENTATION=+